MPKTIHKYICGCGRTVERVTGNLLIVKCFECKRHEKRERTKAIYKGEKLSFKQDGPLRTKTPPKPPRPDHSERNEKILELRLSGMTLEQVAQSLNPVITRERVRQILRKLSIRHGIDIPLRFNKPKVMVETDCKICSQKITLYQPLFKGHGRHRHKNCLKYRKPDGTPMTKAEIYMWLYHNNPERRSMIKEATRKWRLRKYHSDPAWREKQNKYRHEWVTKKLASMTPEQRKAHKDEQRARQRTRYLQIMADPVKREAFKKADQIRIKRYKDKKKLSTPDSLPNDGN